MPSIPKELHEHIVAKLCHDLANDLGNLQLGISTLTGATVKLREEEPLLDKITQGILHSSQAAIAKHAIIRASYGNSSFLEGSTLQELVKMIEALNKHSTKCLSIDNHDLKHAFTAMNAKLFLNLYSLSDMIIPYSGTIRLMHLDPVVFKLEGERITNFLRDDIINPKSVHYHYCKTLAESEGLKLFVPNEASDLVGLSLL